MKLSFLYSFSRMRWLSRFFIVAVVMTWGVFTHTNVHAADPAPALKQTMKQMRLHYLNALESTSPEVFNQQMQAFATQLGIAQAYDFSPERKQISLQGLNKVEQIVRQLPQANAENLSQLQQQLQQVDQLRKEYHKKAKPSVWDLIFDLFK